MRGRKAESLPPHLEAVTEAPDAPDWLPAAGQAEWRRVVPTLVRRRTLTVADFAALESYCLAIAYVRQGQEQIAEEGMTIRAGNGRLMRHPALQTIQNYMTESRRLASELGLTPTSRERLGSHEGQGEMFDDLDI